MSSSPLSEFIRNATPEEKTAVYGRVMDMACLAQRITVHGCRKAEIANMDHVRLLCDGKEDRVNRVCTTCWRHWAGPVAAVVEYSKAEWDALVADAFSVDKI